MDYYEILDISRNADDNDIKKAFRKKAREYHPDINKNPDSTSRFELIYIAYEILSDPIKRKIYDERKSAEAMYEMSDENIRRNSRHYASITYEELDETLLSKINFHTSQGVGCFFGFALMMIGMLFFMAAYFFFHQNFDGRITITLLAVSAAFTLIFYGSKALLKVFEIWRK